MKRLLTFLTLLTVFIGVGWAADVTDVLTRTTTGVTGTSYSDWSGKTATSNAVYAGNSAGGNSSIQLRTNNSNSGIVTTTSGGKVKSITVSWNSNTSNGRSIDIYGKNSAYSAATDLYGNNAGTLLGSIVYGASTTLTVSGDYQYIGIRSNSGALYLTSVTIVWEEGGQQEPDPTTPSGTITFNPVSGSEVTSGTTVAMTFSGTCDGIKYTLDGTSPSAINGTVYDASNPPAITGATTITAAAYNYSNSTYAFGTEATASYTVTIPSVDYDGKATFNATVDIDDENITQGSGSITKTPITFACNDGILGNETEYRLYKNSTTTFSVPANSDYKIVKIEFTCTSGNPISGFASTTGLVTDGNNGTWTGEAESVSFVASNKQVRCTLINVYFTAPDVTSEIKRVIKTNGDADNESGGWIGDWSDNCTTPEEISGNHYTVTAAAGQTIQFKAGCNTNYQILEGNVSAVDASGTTVTLTKVSSDNSGIVFSFIMPASDVTITANFTNYRGTLRLAGHFNGNSTWRTGTNGPAFSYDSATDKYTISAYFTGLDDGGANDYFCLTLDGVEKHPQADNGNYYIYDLNGGAMPFNLSGGSNNNFGCAPGVYNIEINGALTSMSFTKQEPTITIGPAEGEVTSGTTVTATSTLTTLISNIKTNFDSNAAGDVAVQVSTDGTNFANSVSITEDATVTAKASIGNIVVTETATYTVSSSATTGDYVKVTSATDLTDGEYLIVYEDGPLAFDGSLTTLDAEGNSIGVTITADNKIPSSATVDAAVFTYNATNKTLQSASGYYIGQTSDANGLKTSTSTQYVNTITFDGSGNANIVSGGAYLRYNATSGQTRFRYFKSSTYTSQKAVALYKKTAASSKSAMPEISPEGGNIVGFSQEVTITQANGGTIYYTTDGTTPTEASTYQYNGKFWVVGANLGDEVTVTAVAKEDGKELSNPAIANYKFVAPATPVFSPGAGTYSEPQTVTLSSDTEGADVYYTITSGLTPAQIVAQGTKYETPITVSEHTTIYAVTVYHDAHANKDALSDSRQAEYKFSEVESVDLPYERPFTDNTFGEFTIYDESNPDEIEVWTLDGTYGAKGTAYDGSSNHAATSWLISPWINMADAYNPTLKFNHTVNKYFSNPKNDATVWIRTYGGEWTQLTTQLPTSASGWVHFDEEYNLSSYSGLIQVGFKYVSTTSKAGTWEIKNFVVSSEKIATPEFNPAAGAYLNEDYPNGLNVELTCSDENVTIWYSTDGVNYSQYSSPINITETTTVYAYSMLDGHKSDVVSANYRLADYVVNDVVFSPASGTYYGDQTVQMFSTTKGVRIYYTTDGSEPSMENGTLYTGEVTINAPGTHQFKAIAYIGSEPSGVTSVDYILNERSTGSYLLHNVNELNTHELDSEHDYQMVNPVQVIFMSTYQNNGYQPEYCLVRDNTGYGMIYFGKQNTYHNNFAKFNMGDWIKGGYSGPITCFNDPNKPGLSDTHPELGSSSRQSEQIHSWSSNLYMSNSPVLPEYLTIPEILASENEGATDYWGHYVHLRKTTIQLIQSDDPGTYTTGQDKDGKWSGSITDEDGNVINYYDKFYLQYDKNWTTTSNDFTNHPRRTFDVYGFVSCYLYADVHYQISPFAFAWIDKPTITVSGGEQTVYAEPQTITLTSPDDPTATLWYKTSEMDDFAKYIPGTTVITVSSTTTIQTYATKMSDFNDELESLVEEVTLTFTTINPPVIAPESGVYKTTDDPVDATITRDSSDGLTNVTIWFTVDGSDPADATNEKRYEYTEANIAEYLTGIDETTTVRAIAQSGSVYSAEAEPRTYTFVKSNGIEYTLITDETQLNENSVYIIVNKANNMALGINQDANHRDAVGVAFKEGTNKAIVYGNDDVAQFTLHSVLASDHIWAFQTNNSNVNGYLYVGANEDNTLLTESEQDTHGNAAAQVLIDETGTDHAATIKFTYEGATDRYMRYYNRNQLFNTYRTVTTSTDDVYIYGVEATPLATIEKEGEKDKQYTIADELIVVHTTADGDNVLLWAKDQGNVSIAKTEKKDGQIDYMMEVAKEQREPWDQSNWVIIKTTPGSNNVDKMLEIKDHYLKPAMVTGEYSNDVNYTITIPVNEHGIAVIPDNAIGEQVEVPYNKNIYCTANFLPDNLNLTEESTGAEGHANNNTETIYYFFMNPKVQEVFTVTYAVWDGSKFVVPEADGTSNDSEIPGAFNVDWTYNSVTEGAAPSALTVNEAYRFTATVARKSIADYSVTPKATSSSPSEALTVYPLDLNPTPDNGQIVTAINNVGYTDGGHEVKSVKYVNVAGIVSDRPFQGVNIVVTEYTDGTRTTTKMLHK